MHWINDMRPLKRECHRLIDEAFRNKGIAYKWMQENTKTGHVATLNQEELLNLMQRLKKKMGRK